MNWTIHFYSERVHKDLVSWPSRIYADFLRLAGLMEQHGADLRLARKRVKEVKREN